MGDETVRGNDKTSQRRADSSLESLLGEVAGEYFERMTSGERPEIEDYAQRYPEIAEQIRCAFPALQVVGDSRAEGERKRTDIDLGGQKTLGDFRILGELGRGGMGVVYEAEQLSVGRKVALKVLMFAALAQEKSLQRFRNEVRAAGALNHRSIVPIHSVGEERGVHFFAMQLIRGQTMAEVIAQLVHLQSEGQPLHGDSISQSLSAAEKPQVRVCTDAATQLIDREQDGDQSASLFSLPKDTRDTQARTNSEGSSGRSSAFVRSATRLGVQTAEALQHAHESGVLHRDIKPGNLMIDAEGQLYITDFGLARIESDVGITMTGDLVGTLRYMSPEQALATRVVIDHRSDIYSLGATLYELLTLRPLFDGDNRQKLLQQIAFEDPPKLRQINRSIPRELETIVLKAIEKEPDERYNTAGELSDDLRAFLEHRPIKAKPPGVIQRAAKWSRRHRSLVASGVVILLLATIALATSTVIVLSQMAQTARALKTAEDNFSMSETYRRQAEEAVDFTQQLLYVRNLSLAAQARKDGDIRKAAALLRRNPAFEDRPELRGFAWGYLSQSVLTDHIVLTQKQVEIRAARYSPDGNQIAIGTEDGCVELWDSHARRRLRVLSGHLAAITQLNFHSSGSHLATASTDGTVRIWPLTSTEEVEIISANPAGEVFDVCFSPNGKTLATGGDDNLIKIWSASSFHEQVVLAGHTKEVRCLAFLPDGKTLVSGSNDDTIKLWDVRSGREVASLEHENFVLSLAVDPQGQLLLGGDNGAAIQVWDLDQQRSIATIRDHLDGVQTLALFDDGDRLVAGDRGGTVRIWNLSEMLEGKDAQGEYLQGHTDRVWSIDVSRDGQRLLTAGRDGSVRMWFPTRTESPFKKAIHDRQVQDLQFVGRGTQLAILDDSGVRFWDSRSGESHDWFSPQAESGPFCFAVSADEQMVAVSYRDGNVVLHDFEVGLTREIAAHVEAGGSADQVAFSPDGTSLATACDYANRGCVWSTSSGEKLAEFELTEDSLSFSPDGRYLACVDYSDCVIISTDTWQEMISLADHSITITDVAFNAQGTLLATSSEDRKIILWDTATWTPRSEINAHMTRVESIAFSPDGRTLASGAKDGTIKLWNVELGQEFFELGRQPLPVVKLAFSPDGRQLLGKLDDDTMVIFEVRSSHEMNHD